VTFVRVRIST